jgi:Skp family chaperone for outer membrane proteins
MFSQGGPILISSSSEGLVIAALAVCFAPLANVSWGQDQGRVCVLDVAEVFKRNQAFESEMEKIRNEAASLKASVEQQFAKLQQEADQLEQYQIGSAERNDLESQLMQKQALLQSKARQSEADLLTREARIYFQTYKQMEEIVAKIANEYNISLVLRYDSQAMKQDDRADVIKGVNRSVVFQKNLDLTNLVSQQLNGVAQAPAGTQSR